MAGRMRSGFARSLRAPPDAAAGRSMPLPSSVTVVSFPETRPEEIVERLLLVDGALRQRRGSQADEARRPFYPGATRGAP